MAHVFEELGLTTMWRSSLDVKLLCTTSPTSVRVINKPIRSSEIPMADRYDAKIKVEPPRYMAHVFEELGLTTMWRSSLDVKLLCAQRFVRLKEES
jgi:hypothetical protein